MMSSKSVTIPKNFQKCFCKSYILTYFGWGGKIIVNYFKAHNRTR